MHSITMILSEALEHHPAAQATSIRNNFFDGMERAWTLTPMYSVDGEPAMGHSRSAAETMMHPESRQVISNYDGSYCAVAGGVAKQCMFANNPVIYPGSVTKGWKLKRSDCKVVIRSLNHMILFPRTATPLQYWDYAYRWSKKSNQPTIVRFLLLHAVSQMQWSREVERRYRKLQIEHIQQRFPLIVASYRNTVPNNIVASIPDSAWVWRTVELIVKNMQWDWLSLQFREREIDRNIRSALHRYQNNT